MGAKLMSKEKALRHGLKAAYIMAEDGNEDAAATIAQSVVSAYRQAGDDGD